MRKLASFLFGLLFALISSPPLYAQTAASAPADKTVVAADPAPTGKAPDEVIKTLADLIHAGKYPEAQRLTAGLLAAYPSDQRLIKATTLLETLAASGSANATPVTGSPSENVAPVQAVARTLSPQLTGMDKVEYNSLIELGRQAQQTTELDQQRTLLRRFMDDSKPFLEKHPNEILLWQLRAASALSVNDVVAGYEAGQRLLASGNADNDPTMQRLLLQLNLKGWLSQAVADNEKSRAHEEHRLAWLLGTWDVSWSWKYFGHTWVDGRGKEEFVLSVSLVQGRRYVYGYTIDNTGLKSTQPDLRGQIGDSEEVSWECYLPSGELDVLYAFRFNRGSLGGTATLGKPGGVYWEKSGYRAGGPFYPSGWLPVISYRPDGDTGGIIITIPLQSDDPKSTKPSHNPVTLSFTKRRA